MACGPVPAKRCAAWWSAAHKLWASLSCFSRLGRPCYCQKKRSLQAKSLCILRIWGCLMLQAVLYKQLTATKAPEKPPTPQGLLHQFTARENEQNPCLKTSMAKKQPNHSGTLKGIQAFVWVARVLYFIKAMLLRRRWTQEMKHRILFDMFLPSILIRYTKYYGRKLPVSALV